MTKGTYNVGETVGPSKDGSFRSCLCAMLVFFSICMILILTVWLLKNSEQKRNPKDDTDIIKDYSGEKSEKIIGEIDKTTSTTRKPRTTTRTTKRPGIQKPTKPPPTIRTTEAPRDSEPTEYDYENEDESIENVPPVVTMPATTESVTEKALDPLQVIKAAEDAETSTLVSTDNTMAESASQDPLERTSPLSYASTKDSRDSNMLMLELPSSTDSFDDTTLTTEVSITDNEENRSTHWSSTEESTIESSGEELQDTTPTSEISTIANVVLTSIDWSTSEESTMHYSTDSSTDYSTDISITDYSTDISITDYSTDISITDYSTDISVTDVSTDFNTDYSTDATTDYSTDITSESISESTTEFTSEDPSSTTTVPVIDIRSFIASTADDNKPASTSTTEQPKKETVPQFETDGTGIPNHPDYEDDEYEVLETKPKHTKDPEQTTEVVIKDSSKQQLKAFKLKLPHAYVCESAGCKLKAGRMLNQLNHTGDACEDFYDYACGGGGGDSGDTDEANWDRIAEKLWQIGSTSPAYLSKFRKYYDTCVSFHNDFNYEQRLNEAKDILHTASRLYDRTQQFPEELTLTELLTRLLLVDSAPLFDIAVDVDKQSQRFILQMTPTTHKSLLQDETHVSKGQRKCFRNIRKKFSKSVIDLKPLYARFLDCQSNYTDYLNDMERAVHAFGDFAHMEPYNVTWHVQNLRTTIEWDVLPQIKIPQPGTSHEEAKAIVDNELPAPGLLRYDILNKKYKIMKVAEMKLQFPLVDWSVLFTRLVGKPVDDEQPVQVYFGGYFRNLFKHLQSMPAWQVHNALLAMYAHDLYNTLVAPIASDNSEHFCLRQTSRLLTEVSSAMYMDAWPDKDITLAASQLDEMFAQLKTNVTDAIKSAEWLDDSSRNGLMMKVTKMQLIATSGTTVWTSPARLNGRVRDVLNNTTGTYQKYAIELLKRHRTVMYELWNEDARDPTNIWWYYLTPYSASPVSIYALNAVVFPIGMALQTPKNIPRYIRLATVGYTMAKEMGRHFDTTGIRYDMKLSKDSAASYKVMERCHVDKYSMSMSHQAKDKIYAYEVDPMLSLNEIIVENFAAKLVSDMSVDVMNDQLMPWISSSFSREKIFFLAMAQEHCKRSSYEDFFIQLYEDQRLPPALLLKNFFGNLKVFVSTFECAVGSGMSHPVKCEPFPEITKEPDYGYLYETK